MAQTSLGYDVDKYSIAQSFYVSEEKGIYLTAIDVFFKTVTDPNTLPVLLELRPMINGFPSSNVIIPGSETVIPASAVQYSTNADATKKTRFEFDEPIFLSGQRDYAFVIATNTSNYELFGAQGDTFVIGSTEKRISKQQTLGSLFFSQNSATFTAAQELDLSFKLIRAKFNKTSGILKLNTASLPRVVLSNNPLSVDSGSQLVTVFHPNHGFQPNDHIRMTVGGGSVGNLDSSKLTGIHKIYDSDGSVDPLRYQILVDSATETAIGGGNAVTVDKNIPYSIIYPNVQTLTPSSTLVEATYQPLRVPKTSSSTFGNASATSRYTQPDDLAVTLNKNNVGNVPYAIPSDRLLDSASHTNGGTLRLDLFSNDSAVSPLIDLQRASLTLIGNQINKQAAATTTDLKFRRPVGFVDESSATGGTASSKHITNVFTLSEDAVGLKVILAAHRPAETDFQVWLRTSAGDEIITDKSFTLLTEETNNPVDNDATTFRDYEYLAGGQGGDLTPFTKFQIKIEIRSSNQAVSPIFSSLRAIALSV